MLDYEEKVKYILVDFSCIFDTDYGVIGFLIYQYKHSKYFVKGYSEWSTYYAKCKILSRPTINPFTAILKEEYFDSADNLYKEVLENHWNKVLRIAPSTDIGKLINQSYQYAGYDITVNCRNELEADRVKQAVPKWHTVIDSKIDNKYFCYFVHDLKSKAEEMNRLITKNFFIYHHKPNFINYKEEIPIPDIAPAILGNKFRIAKPYNDLVFPYDMTPDDVEVNQDVKSYKAK